MGEKFWVKSHNFLQGQRDLREWSLLIGWDEWSHDFGVRFDWNAHHSMVCNITWCVMVCCGVSWCVVVCCGVPWCVVVCCSVHGVPWCARCTVVCVVCHGVLWCVMRSMVCMVYQKLIWLLKIVNCFQSIQPFLHIQTQTPKTLLPCNRSGPAHIGDIISTEKLKHIRVPSIVNPFWPNCNSL